MGRTAFWGWAVHLRDPSISLGRRETVRSRFIAASLRYFGRATQICLEIAVVPQIVVQRSTIVFFFVFITTIILAAGAILPRTRIGHDDAESWLWAQSVPRSRAWRERSSRSVGWWRSTEAASAPGGLGAWEVQHRSCMLSETEPCITLPRCWGALAAPPPKSALPPRWKVATPPQHVLFTLYAVSARP